MSHCWKASGEEVQAAVHAALEAGYRHIDTAHLYGNEADIGKVLAEWIGSGRLKREDLFITNKVRIDEPSVVELIHLTSFWFVVSSWSGLGTGRTKWITT